MVSTTYGIFLQQNGYYTKTRHVISWSYVKSTSNIKPLRAERQYRTSTTLSVYLALQPLVQPAGDHASGVGLDGDDGPQPVPERPPHQVAPAATLKACDSLTGHVIRCTQLPGTHQSLEAREARSHLQKQSKRRRKFTVLFVCTAP